MIGMLKGTVAHIEDGRALIDVNGVGYEVEAPVRLLSRLAAGQAAELVIETLVAETSLRLVGFASRSERSAFRLLQTVQGVGAKAALSILNVLSPDELYDALSFGDRNAVARAQGVGPKLATRIVTELKGRAGELISGETLPDAPVTGAEAASVPRAGQSGARRDAVLALEGLGYDAVTAGKAVAGVPRAEGETVENVIADALRGLASA